MNKYGQYCPLARAIEILGDRWTLLIVRDLFVGAQHFNQLERGLPGISRALLSGRLRRLQHTGLVERRVEAAGRKVSYHLTPAGLALRPVVEELTLWGAQWAFGEPESEELNPTLLLWWMRGRVYRERLPAHRVVVEFKFREVRPPTYWLVLEPADVSVCLTHPGYEVDMQVTAYLSSLLQVWLGRITFDDAVRQGQVELDAAPLLADAFPTWFALSPVSGIVRSAMQAASIPAGIPVEPA